MQWLEWTPGTQAADFERISRVMLGYALEDLAELPEQPPVVVEGPQVVPDLLPDGARAVVLLPSPGFQRVVLEPRPMPSSDPRRALAARLVKDRLWAERVAGLARARGVPVLEVDGTRGPDELREEVEHLFPAFFARAGDADLGRVRRWENECHARNLRAWVASGDLRGSGGTSFAFACECGRRGCGETVSLTLAELDVAERVLAPQHAAR